MKLFFNAILMMIGGTLMAETYKFYSKGAQPSNRSDPCYLFEI